ncbi:ABC transporter substrate-binding protein [Sphingobacterium daejeonense]|uniref:heme/hemin ABC transporter substrate-binding protein n=1 Tax=Sphingobacterium daejeonense TaxID=371142 RepID=UPI0021A7BC98|nr:ABC transporter substrate-binding protein [Sphingobacterium daejeonense]MCT1532568.1 ABC transporter substrate-binding protein [Sphingobacterium daejeonense]
MNKINRFILSFGAACLLFSCQNTKETSESADTTFSDTLRIVSLNGTVSEIISELGLEDQIVGTDVASTYPASMNSKPKVGHNKKVPVEGVMALNPNLIIGTKQEVNPETIEQFKQAGIRTVLFDQEYSVEGTRKLIKGVSDSLKLTQRGDSLIGSFDKAMETVSSYESESKKPKVLFIYARGAGTMMVGGTGTQVDKVIELAGGINVAKDFADYKPLTPEALVAYNPDVILLFSSGLSSLGNETGMMNIQGVKETNAGRNKKIIAMDGQLLSGFSSRLPIAIEELHSKIH